MARVAARFCLLYDNGRWSMKRESKQLSEDECGYADEERSNGGRSSSGTTSSKKGESKKSLSSSDETRFNVEKDLLRMFAEVHFINGEVRNIESHFLLLKP